MTCCKLNIVHWITNRAVSDAAGSFRMWINQNPAHFPAPESFHLHFSFIRQRSSQYYDIHVMFLVSWWASVTSHDWLVRLISTCCLLDFDIFIFINQGITAGSLEFRWNTQRLAKNCFLPINRYTAVRHIPSPCIIYYDWMSNSYWID